jgi:hypothetical protein
MYTLGRGTNNKQENLWLLRYVPLWGDAWVILFMITRLQCVQDLTAHVVQQWSVFFVSLFNLFLFLMTFFWVKSPWGLFGRSRRFGEACCLHLQGWSDELELGGIIYGGRSRSWRRKAGSESHSIPTGPFLHTSFLPFYIMLLSPSSSLEPWRLRQHASSKRWLLPTSPRDGLTQKNVNRIVTAVKILNAT